jgi:hypothetical protein
VVPRARKELVSSRVHKSSCLSIFGNCARCCLAAADLRHFSPEVRQFTEGHTSESKNAGIRHWKTIRLYLGTQLFGTFGCDRIAMPRISAISGTTIFSNSWNHDLERQLSNIEVGAARLALTP